MIWWENRTLGEVVFHAEYGFITKSCENLFWCITDLYARFDADWTYSDPNCFTTLNQDCLTKLPFYMWNTLDSRKTHNLPTKSRASTTFSNQLLPINPSTTKNVKHSYSSTKHSWFLHHIVFHYVLSLTDSATSIAVGLPKPNWECKLKVWS